MTVRFLLAFAASVAVAATSLRLGSTAFTADGSVPPRYTCDGEDVSPPLDWSNPPAGTKGFALVVDDPDAPDPKAPRVRWVHWIVYDLPVATRALPEAVRSEAELPPGAKMGQNDWGKAEWGGPCPPVGRHRYVFTLYALDLVLGERGPLSRRGLEVAIDGHVIGKAELLGTYERAK